MATAQRRRRGTQTAAEAVQAAQDAGQEVATARDEAGNEFAQRPITLSEENTPRAPVKPTGDKVKVYHKRNTKMFLGNGETLGPHEEKFISRQAAEHPGIAPYIVRLAE